jgi:hypothetical protein
MVENVEMEKTGGRVMFRKTTKRSTSKEKSVSKGKRLFYYATQKPHPFF